jgi:hypothetical protein
MNVLRALAFGALLSVAACRSPTEVELTIHTDLPCSNPEQWHGVAIYLGAAGPGLETQAPTLLTHKCDKTGKVGTLMIVPSGDDDELIGVRVVAGTTTLPEDCHDKGYKGCIVARRRLRFRPNQKVSLDVELEGQCEHVPCDSDSTCLTGTCLGVQEVARSEPELPSEPPEDKRVRCGDNRRFCATSGNVCCLTTDLANQTTHGECMPSTDCAGVVLFCDDAADCAPVRDELDGSPALCMLSYVANGIWEQPVSITNSACMTFTQYQRQSAQGLALCEDEQPCRRAGGDIEQCVESAPRGMSQLPGYSWCEIQ